ncbi:MAG: hypothetical protein KBF32_10620 [Chitinophagales bacterium]|nr:hypothetical protein [Chitinophagales bacterium]
MKTLKTLLILVIMLTGQFSFGNSNENCCPDTTNAHLATSSVQMQLDQVQKESNLMSVSLPSLETNVSTKLFKQRNMLDQIQLETERLENTYSWPFLEQLRVKLNLSVEDAGLEQTEDTTIKL